MRQKLEQLTYRLAHGDLTNLAGKRCCDQFPRGGRVPCSTRMTSTRGVMLISAIEAPEADENTVPFSS